MGSEMCIRDRVRSIVRTYRAVGREGGRHRIFLFILISLCLLSASSFIKEKEEKGKEVHQLPLLLCCQRVFAATPKAKRVGGYGSKNNRGTGGK